MAEQEVVTESAGWWETLKDHAYQAWVKIQESQNLLLAIAIYGGIGFIAGYFLKKYAHFIAFFIVLSVLLVVMQQFDYITFSINWTKIQGSMCLPAGVDMTVPSIAGCIFEWTRANVAQAVSLVVGFLIGLRFG